MQLKKELLKELTGLRGVSGDEGAVRDALRTIVAPLCDEVLADTMGNLIATRDGGDGTKPHVMLAAHMDEVGFIVMSATDAGLLRIQPVGGVDPRVAVSKRVLVGPAAAPGVIGAKAIHLQSASDFDTVLGFDSLYVDVGAATQAKAEELCPPGSYITFDSPYVEFGDRRVKAKALDDRVGCLAMVHALQTARYPGKLTCAFTVQEEVGLRGAAIAAYRVAPDLALVLEGTTCNDLGDVPPHLQVTRQGKGVAISVMDLSAIANAALLSAVRAAADARGIPWQHKQYVAGGTDAGAIHKSRRGVPCTVLSVPCRYIHSAASTAHLDDIAAQQALVVACLEDFANKNPL
ncbi:MAG: M20/M25/M40 family metallo-hydrolase [Clostridia bacterium]|nr:M20/M25/M40 family metallo-hydrolase [Clostridia bacterium]